MGGILPFPYRGVRTFEQGAFSNNLETARIRCSLLASGRTASRGKLRKVRSWCVLPRSILWVNSHDHSKPSVGRSDHFWPLRAGGSNEPENLWYQPAENEWNKESFGFRKRIVLSPNYVKDIKTRSVRLEEAYEKLTTDWVVYYHAMRNHSDLNVVDKGDE